MKRNVYFMSSVLLVLFCFWSCSDQEDGINPSTMLQIYGCQYDLTSGVIWKNNPAKIISTVPYVYEDIYLDETGQQVTDEVTGFTASSEQSEMGNFMLSLYETGLAYNADLESMRGKAACICFHLNSPDLNELTTGKYVYGTEKKAHTFIGYCSSDYDVEVVTAPATLSEGEVTVEKSGNEYKITFRCKTSFGGEVSGEYKGELKIRKVPLESSTAYYDVPLAGLMDTIVSESVSFGTPDPPEIGLDTDNGAAFFSTASGNYKVASAGGKEGVDIALVWDKKKEVFYFESPIRMRSLLGHDDTYNFPCHTIYMKAPDSFKDADFEKLEETGFSFRIQEEKVEIGTADFSPGYVFFETGKGFQGVIRVKGYTPLGSKVEDWQGLGWIFTTTPVNPALKLDIKCPANFVNPRIR